MTQQDPLRPGIVHRLDKETSGVLLVAKNEYAHEILSKQFKTRQVEKRYLALVHGELSQTEGVIDVPIGRDVRSRTRISTRSNRLREAQTAYEVLERLHRFTYVKALPRTGRTHQIRVHFHYLGHPVVGDKIYSKGEREKVRDSRKFAAIRKSGRHFLHATFLKFVHPTTGEEMSFESPLPRELEQLLVTLGE
jgi:23S rRNA pseudouridine1911/1915/1917 synthase